MDSIVSAFTSLPSTKAKKDDDFSDRLSSRYTVLLLIVFAIVVSIMHNMWDPIKCWAPVHFTGNHVKYTNSYCWVRNTYYLPFHEEIPRQGEERDHIPYYQWIPFILLGQACLFYFPSVVWHALNQRGGVDADNLLAAANTFNKTDKVEHRDATLRIIQKQMHRFLSTRRGVGKQSWKTFFAQRTFMGRRFGAYLTTLYLVTKVLYFLNVVGQLFLLNLVLATDYSIYGIEVVTWMTQGQVERDWHNSPHDAFPRVTMCDFRIRRLGNVHPYTVQCTLPINLYNEKIYMFLWFWMLFVAIITLISICTWLARACMRIDRIRYIQNHLKMAGKIETDQDKRDSEKFVKGYLRPDGVFLMRLIGHNTNTITVTEVITALWDKWQRPEILPTTSVPDPEEDPSAPPGDMEMEPLKPEKEPLPAD